MVFSSAISLFFFVPIVFLLDRSCRTWMRTNHWEMMLKRFNGMSTVVLDELAVRSGLDKNALVQDLSPADKFSWCRCIERLGQELDGVSGASSIRSRERKSSSPWSCRACLLSATPLLVH